MTDTRTKMEEASFFLAQLEASEDRHPQFDYYLNAFICSARSVFWIMRHEYSRVPRWKSWYDSVEPTARQKSLFGGFNKARIRAQKRIPLRTGGRILLHISQEALTDDLKQRLEGMAGKRLKVSMVPRQDRKTEHTQVDDKASSFTARLEKFWHVLAEFPDENVLQACRDYYQVLESIATECERRFPLK